MTPTFSSQQRSQKKGKPHRCLRLAETGKIQSITCAEILQEFAEKLTTKFEYSDERVDQVVSEIKRFSQIVVIANTLKVIAADPEDDKIWNVRLQPKQLTLFRPGKVCYRGEFSVGII